MLHYLSLNIIEPSVINITWGELQCREDVLIRKLQLVLRRKEVSNKNVLPVSFLC